MSEPSSPRPRATAVPENALTPAEIDGHLRASTLCRLSTLRSDGGIHLTPMWFLWDGERIHLSLHETRLHLRNLRRDPTLTVLVDEDHRPGAGFDREAWAVMARGRAELSAEPAWVLDIMRGLLTKAVGGEVAAERVQAASADRTIVSLRPEAWLTWDFTKAYYTD